MKNIISGFFLWVFTGWKAWQLKRLEECNVCAPNRDVCPACGCFKEPKVKVKKEKCPLNKWQ